MIHVDLKVKYNTITALMGHVHMMSAKCSDFFDVLPLVCIGQLIYTIKFTQPPLLCLLFGMPLAVQTSYLHAP